MNFFKRLWNSLRRVFLAVLVVILVIVAIQAILIAFQFAPLTLTWLPAGVAAGITAVATWAAGSPWLFAAASLGLIGVVDPEAAKRIIRDLGEVAVEITSALVEVAGQVASAAFPWLPLAAVAAGGYLLLRSTSGRKT